MKTISLKPDQQIFFTSDWHWNHKNLCKGTSSWGDKSGCRDFDSLEAMNDCIVNNFNSVVKPDDIVFNLGDVIFGDKQQLPTFLAKLNCKNIYLIRGNHDDYLETEKCRDFNKLFLGVFDYLDVVIKRKNKRSLRTILFHYPIASWRDMSDGTINLHGHSHGSFPDCPNLRRLDVGVDVDLYGHRKFFPWSLDEIENVMYNLKENFIPVDHHGNQNH